MERRDLFSSQGLDLTFGNAGVVEQAIAGTGCYADAVAVQPDGKIVVAGATANPASNGLGIGQFSGFLLSRYNADGTPDLSFGSNGSVTSNDPRLQAGPLRNMVVEGDGKLLVESKVGLLQFNANGTLDTSFGQRGLSDSGEGTWVAQQSDGKILTSDGVAIERLNPDGTRDLSFGTQGFVEGASDYQFIIAPDGKIIAAGALGIERITADGKFDNTFGTGGIVYVHPGTTTITGKPFVVADGDKYDWIGYVRASNQSGPCDAIEVVRFNSDGTVDTTFGDNGHTIISSQEPTTNSFSAVMQSDGKLVIVGRSGTVSAPGPSGIFVGNIFTARLDADGALDPTWGPGGTQTIAVGSSSEALAAVQAGDGQIVLAGDALPLNPTSQEHELIMLRLSGYANQKFVQGAFSDLLSRPADPASLDYFSTQLDTGTVSRHGLLQILQSSPEYLQNIVRDVYAQFLKRPADSVGLSGWTAYLELGETREQLETLILASDEFYNHVSGGDDGTFLNNLFLLLLNRPIDAAGRAAFEEALAGGASRDSIIEDILRSAEFDLATVNELYLQPLGRLADPSGLAAFAFQLEAGASFDQVVSQMVESEEYYSRS